MTIGIYFQPILLKPYKSTIYVWSLHKLVGISQKRSLVPVLLNLSPMEWSVR